jgi:hypothetical protein
MTMPAGREACILAAAALVLGGVRVARADEAVIPRPPLPEPIFTESTTDIDGYEPGEIEFDVNGSRTVARRNGASVLLTSVEVEWKVWNRLGVRLEPSLASAREELAPAATTTFGFRSAAGWNLVHDFRHDFHLQIEAAQRFLDDTPYAFRIQPGEAPLPFSADLKAAVRALGWTLRASVGTEAGGTPAHAPFRLQAALMHPFTSEMRFGFFGLEMDADWGRPDPVVVAPNVWADVTPIGLPARLGVGIPVVVGAPETYPAAGVYLRLLILTSREASFEAQEKKSP